MRGALRDAVPDEFPDAVIDSAIALVEKTRPAILADSVEDAM